MQRCRLAATLVAIAYRGGDSASSDGSVVITDAATGNPSLIRRESLSKPTAETASMIEVNRSESETQLPKVWCGGHFAADCAECSAQNGVDWCNGDCTFSERYEECVLRPDLMWCGAHASISCEECVWDGDVFRGKSWCNGECFWLEANGIPGQCHAKYPNAPPVPDELPAPSADQLSSKHKSFLMGTVRAGSRSIKVWSSAPFQIGDEVQIGKMPWVDSRRIVAIKVPESAQQAEKDVRALPFAQNDNATLVLESPIQRKHMKWSSVTVHSTVVLHKIKRRHVNVHPQDVHPRNASEIIYTKGMDGNLTNCPRAKDVLIDDSQMLARALYVALAAFLGASAIILAGVSVFDGSLSEAPEARDARIEAEAKAVKDGGVALRTSEVPVDPSIPVTPIIWKPGASEEDLQAEQDALFDFMKREEALAEEEGWDEEKF